MKINIDQAIPREIAYTLRDLLTTKDREIIAKEFEVSVPTINILLRGVDGKRKVRAYHLGLVQALIEKATTNAETLEIRGRKYKNYLKKTKVC
ncbi:MAG: hypothetical protein N4A45_10490 [Flavobacteriales bacterium]|jgi:hypothetical protein|nr:hypothetical protein [Flavobacteriales bacterium]